MMNRGAALPLFFVLCAKAFGRTFFDVILTMCYNHIQMSAVKLSPPERSLSMDEKKIEEMRKLGTKQDLTPEERARFNELFDEFIDKKMGGFYPHKKHQKVSGQQ